MELRETSVELCVTKILRRRGTEKIFHEPTDIAGEAPLWNSVKPLWNSVKQKYYAESHRENTEKNFHKPKDIAE